MPNTIDPSRLKNDPIYFIEQLLWVVNKDRKKVPFKLNDLQRLYYSRRTHDDLILKDRKRGFSTLIEALYLHACINVPNTNAISMAHTMDDTKTHMDRVRYFIETMGPTEDSHFQVELDKDNQRELYFPKLNSYYWIGTAGSRKFGRGRDVTHLHLSECAFYSSQEVVEGVLQACVPGAFKALETTANGVGGLFHRVWQETTAPVYKGPWKAHFYGWHQSAENVADECIGKVTREDRDMQNRFKLSDRQVYWYVNTRAGMLDQTLMPQEHPSEPREAFLTSGNCIFDRQGLSLQESKVIKPDWVGYLRDMRDYIQAVPDDQGNLRIYETPKDDEEYEVGADAADGVEGGDYSSAHVLNKRTWKVVAHWHGHIDPLGFADVLQLLGLYYNTAEIACEYNRPGNSTVDQLVKSGYVYLYQREPKKYGWLTDKRSRANMVSFLQECIKDGSVEIRDRDTLDECYNFVRHDNGDIAARAGCFDDRVVSLAIALQVTRVNPFHEEPKRHRQRTMVSALARPKRRTGY